MDLRVARKRHTRIAASLQTEQPLLVRHGPKTGGNAPLNRIGKLSVLRSE
jgi:hypothetical protein